MADPQIRALAKRLQKLERARLQSKQPTLGYSSIDDGAITAVDQDSNLKMVIGKQFDDTHTSAVVSGPTPPTPTVPLAIGQTGSIRVYWDGTFVGGALAPMDFARVLVYAKPLSAYTGPEPVNQTIIVGQFTSATGGEISAVLDSAIEYAVYLVCWTQAGVYGSASLVDTVTPISAPGTTDGAVPSSSPNVNLEPLGYSGVMIRWSAVTNADPVRYRIFFDTVNPPVQAFPDTAGLILSTSVLPDGTPLVAGTTYYAQALALDDDGQAASKGLVDSGGPIVVPATSVAEEVLVANEFYSRQGYFGQVSADQVVTGDLIAALAIVGGLSVGPGITITPDNGIQITTVNGTSQIPTDGSAITLKAEVIASALDIVGRLIVRGSDNEIAKSAVVTLSSGVSDPKVGPQLSSTYYQAGSHIGFVPRGFAYHATQNRWLKTESLSDAIITQLYRPTPDGDYTHALESWSLKTDGGRSEVMSAVGGLTVIGDNVYMLCTTNEQWSSALPWQGRWWIYKVAYNPSWTTNQNRWTFVWRTPYLSDGTTTILSGRSGNRPTIGNDGTDIWVVQAASNGDHYLTRYNNAGTLVANPAVMKQADTTTNFNSQQHCSALLRGTFDIGTDGWIVMHENYNNAYWFNTSRNRVVANEFPTPSTPNLGALWDGTRFRIMSEGYVRHTSKFSGTDLASNPINAVQTWRLADAASPDYASAETKPSPRSQYSSLPKRAWLKITSPVDIPNDPSDANDPDALTFYVTRGTGTPANSSYKRVPPPMTARNLVPNPSFEVNTTGWANSNNATIARVTNPFYTGAAAASMTAVATASDMAITTPAGTAGMPVVGGKAHTGQARFNPAATPNRSVRVDIKWYDATGALISTSTGASVTQSGWTRATVTATSPSNAAYAAILPTVLSPTAGEVHYLDSVMLDDHEGIATYGDGSIAGWRWTGTAHQSSSHLEAGGLQVILDELPATGDAPPTSSGFSTTGASPAHVKSFASDGSGSIISLKGDGSGRVGPYAWDSSGADTNDTGWAAPSLQNSWVNYGSTWEIAGYRKKNGFVQLRGLIKSGVVTSGTTLFTLPTGFRPLTDKHVICVSAQATCVLNIMATGIVKINAGASATYISLADISFIAEQ